MLEMSQLSGFNVAQQFTSLPAILYIILLQLSALFEKTYTTKQKRKKVTFFDFEKTLKTLKKVLETTQSFFVL